MRNVSVSEQEVAAIASRQCHFRQEREGLILASAQRSAGSGRFSVAALHLSARRPPR
jgi:hypothetical protein